MATWIYTCGKPNNTTHTCKWVHVNLVKSEKKSLACNNVHWPVWRCYPWGKLGKGDRGQLCFLSFPDLKLFQNKKIKKKTATYNYNEDNIMCTFWHLCLIKTSSQKSRLQSCDCPRKDRVHCLCRMRNGVSSLCCIQTAPQQRCGPTGVTYCTTCSVSPWRPTGTCKSHADVVIQGTDLPHSPLILKLGDWLLFYPQYNDIGTTNSNLSNRYKI